MLELPPIGGEIPEQLAKEMAGRRGEQERYGDGVEEMN